MKPVWHDDQDTADRVELCPEVNDETGARCTFPANHGVFHDWEW